MLVKSLFLWPSKRCRSSDLENKMPLSSEVNMVPKKVSAIKEGFHLKEVMVFSVCVHVTAYLSRFAT